MTYNALLGVKLTRKHYTKDYYFKRGINSREMGLQGIKDHISIHKHLSEGEKKNSKRKDSRVLQHTWAELPLNTQCFPKPSRKHGACPAAGTLSNFLLHVASFPCLGKCFWDEGTCSFRPQSFHFAGEMLESSERPGNAQGPPQLPVRRGPLSLNLFSTPQPSSDNV